MVPLPFLQYRFQQFNTRYKYQPCELSKTPAGDIHSFNVQSKRRCLLPFYTSQSDGAVKYRNTTYNSLGVNMPTEF